MSYAGLPRTPVHVPAPPVLSYPAVSAELSSHCKTLHSGLSPYLLLSNLCADYCKFTKECSELTERINMEKEKYRMAELAMQKHIEKLLDGESHVVWQPRRTVVQSARKYHGLY